ncbi:DUF3347 domain-containing protein [Flammeovirga yaeyamensis]|uniref:DUF3347 domain-containing protein n=1 Tax=Flammeovirga yaeyamensis TaxID=367791 RepID=A0AAX1NBJ3_9BACT|nr:DUF3347 domain-containing protein [Flammeovirga yaeyamensis]MBB3698795.1 hypothetical protein [Flammeovirga yaeyamensis]NMF37380.1 DUF3347 domain-containing protein [Flammeovirga yaeyamensis]QWG03806.1 DUF3347 domain-containing protein [Flammeovirga yaeyamensis]
MRKLILLPIFLVALLFSCQSNEGKKQVKEEEKVELKPVVYDTAKAKGHQAYFKLSECLVKSNPTAAQTYAKRLLATMPEGIDVGVKTATENIIASADLATQRKEFQAVTAYYQKVAEEGNAGMDVYVVHCPMAFNNTGADWLSATNEVDNPYFGDEMLHCGRVMKEIKK